MSSMTRQRRGPRIDYFFGSTHRTHCALDTVRVHLDAAVVEKAHQTIPAAQAIADRHRDGALLRDRNQPGLEPSLELSTNGFVSACRTARRSSALRPRIRLSMVWSAAIRSSASWAIGAGPPLSISKNSRRQCNQQKAGITAPPPRAGSASCSQTA
jgi:hypothetical protein